MGVRRDLSASRFLSLSLCCQPFRVIFRDEHAAAFGARNSILTVGRQKLRRITLVLKPTTRLNPQGIASHQ
ncbi:hypothetical protein VTH06DRAFT_4584 [Thermothelomyces fergusii]